MSQNLVGQKPEKDKVNIYDEDEAYMLNDEKDNGLDDDLHNADLKNFDPKNELNENYINSGRDNNNQDFDDEDLLGDEQNESGGHIRNNMHNNNYQDENEENQMSAERDNILNQNRYIDGTVRTEVKVAKKLERENSKSISNLVTLKYISVCQSCKENFNSSSNVPYLLKCGHFFCRSCLENNFTEDDGSIFCPDDGIVANHISELKLLNNLIVERSVDNEDGGLSSNRGNQTVNIFLIYF